MPFPNFTNYPVWSVSVTRTQLVLSDLLLTDPINGYYIFRNGIGPGPQTLRKVTANSPFIEGRYLVNKVKDTQIFKCQVLIRAISSDWMDFQLRTVIDAFSQDTFNMTVNIDSVTHVWQCESADGWAIGQGGQWDEIQGASYTQSVVFNVPRFPTPLGGRF